MAVVSRIVRIHIGTLRVQGADRAAAQRASGALREELALLAGEAPPTAGVRNDTPLRPAPLRLPAGAAPEAWGRAAARRLWRELTR